MASYAGVFEPKTIRNILKGLEKSNAAKEKFEKAWNLKARSCIAFYDNKDTPTFQLKFEAEVVEYVNYLHSKLAVHGNSSVDTKKIPKLLESGVPFLGPQFAPPTFLHYMRRDATPAITPECAYIRAITVIHPVYYSTELVECPQCASTDIRWDGWNGTGARTVHGIARNERAIGYQMRCKTCKDNKKADKYCFATTNHVFWKNWEHWKIPRHIPYFMHRSAVSRELFNLIIELRLSTTAAGLAEHLKQLHLRKYHDNMQEYLLYFKSARQNPLRRINLQDFSSPTDPMGYNDTFVSNDLIAELYLEFVAKSRKPESVEYCKTRTAKSVSLDNTFKSASKASIVGKDGQRQNPLKGGILSAINEEGEGIAWRFCISNSPAESRELLQGIRKRHEFMKLPKPSAVIVDNCCQVRNFVIDGLGPGTAVLLDVYHFIMRYNAVIFGGAKNPHRREVLVDIRNAIIKTPAKANYPATYWTQAEQEVNITEVFNKWLKYDNVWSVAATKVHADQLQHVRKGCLARPRKDIAMDGSRIEGSHKAWNSLQRAQPSGIETYSALGHDFFLRRNIRVASSCIENNRPVNCSDFIASTHASHHIHLVNHTTKLFNSLYEKEPPASRAKLSKYPTLPQIQVDEMIGLVESVHSLTFGGHLEAKVEAPDSDARVLLDDLDAQIEETDQAQFVRMLGVDEHDISTMMARTTITANAILSTSASSSSGAFAPASTSSALPLNSTAPLPASQKRKQHSETDEHADDIPDSKRRRHAGQQVSFSDEPWSEPSSLELNQMPEAYSTDSSDDLAPGDCEPMDTVVTTEAPIPLLNAQSTPAEDVPHAFFAFQRRDLNKLLPAAATPSKPTPSTVSLDALRHPLPLPLSLQEEGLTRSQLIFSIGTAIDPRALRIDEGDEFFLFMDMRIEFQWTSFGMTAAKWASAAQIYNNRLEGLNKKKDVEFIKKNPRALADKLNEVERQINERNITKNYASKSGKVEFWTKHCQAVPALHKTMNLEAGDSSTANSTQLSEKKRKSPECKRCKTPTANHKRGVCGDGVASKLTNDSPPWPQPQGIFKDGEFFDPAKFLVTLRDLYERVVDQSMPENGGARATVEYSLEDVAFSRMFESRTKTIGGHPSFRLYNLKFLGGSYESLVSEFEGDRYLRMDCL
ncbi:hypothetical protein BJ912DRAFT_1079230 [Pholiota molesta]|nr:hypothetical protein BJ912DRAFT_1079230 [Pholiota molesta]